MIDLFRSVKRPGRFNLPRFCDGAPRASRAQRLAGNPAPKVIVPPPKFKFGRRSISDRGLGCLDTPTSDPATTRRGGEIALNPNVEPRLSMVRIPG